MDKNIEIKEVLEQKLNGIDLKCVDVLILKNMLCEELKRDKKTSRI